MMIATKKKKARYVLYLRVSTKRQGNEGIGIDAQRDICQNFIKQNQGTNLAEFVEHESGRKMYRPILNEAIAFCEKENAILLVSHLDRLARRSLFFNQLLESNLEVAFATYPDMPRIGLQVMANFAEETARSIAEKTQIGLNVRKKELKKKGYFISKTGKKRTKLGPSLATKKKAAQLAGKTSTRKSIQHAQDIVDDVLRAMSRSSSYSELAKELTQSYVPTFRQFNAKKKTNPRDDDSGWHPSSARNTVKRIHDEGLADCSSWVGKIGKK